MLSVCSNVCLGAKRLNICLIPFLFQIVLSYEDLYLRLEESFVGAQGTFALLTGSSQKTEEFVNVLRHAIERIDSGINLI